PVQAAGTSITRLAAQTKWEDYIETRKFFESEIFTLAAKDRKILDETVTEWIDTLRSETLDKNIH
ncbi:hypothetical protein NK983_35750, partial [Salmonella enterica subsp. enterica serovar Typhimurium]|nr:hypothetical protein [Salmonella enterica subsp. enterica serovar Typhimurium]